MLYEAACYFALFAWLLRMVKRGAPRGKGEGFLLGVFFTVLFGARFFIEFVKELQVSSEAALPLDLGQLLSIPFVGVGVFLMLRALRRADSSPKR